MKKWQILLLIVPCSLLSGLAMASDDEYPLEDWSYINDRKKVHTSEYVGYEMPERYIAYLSAAFAKTRSLHSTEGLTDQGSGVIKKMQDDLDLDEAGTQARNALVSEMCSRLAANDPDVVALGKLMNDIERTDVEAVAQKFRETTRHLDSQSATRLDAALQETISTTTMRVTDYAGLAMDVPNYVRSLLTEACKNYQKPSNVAPSNPDQGSGPELNSSGQEFYIDNQ